MDHILRTLSVWKRGELSENRASGSISRDEPGILTSLTLWKEKKKSTGRTTESSVVIYSDSVGRGRYSDSVGSGQYSDSIGNGRYSDRVGDSSMLLSTKALDNGTMPSGLETPITILLNSSPISNLSTGSWMFHSCSSEPSPKLNWNEKNCSSDGCDAIIIPKAKMSAFLFGTLNYLL